MWATSQRSQWRLSFTYMSEQCNFTHRLNFSTTQAPPLPHFLVVLATTIRSKLQKVKGLPCLLQRRSGCRGLWYKFWYPQGGSIVSSEVPVPCTPWLPPTPHCKILPTSGQPQLPLSLWNTLNYLQVLSSSPGDGWSPCLEWCGKQRPDSSLNHLSLLNGIPGTPHVAYHSDCEGGKDL